MIVTRSERSQASDNLADNVLDDRNRIFETSRNQLLQALVDCRARDISYGIA